jgi:hypothetical protein
MVRYLLIRPDDHLIVGCDLVGCVLAPASDTGATPATVSAPAAGPPGGSARLVVTFPPQHVAEQLQDASVTAAPSSGTWQTALAGPSRLAVGLPPGASIPFTVSGLLTALGQYPVISDDTGAADSTAIEAPWRLVTSPHPPADDQTLQALHRPVPLDHGGVTGLWRTSIASPPAPATPDTGGGTSNQTGASAAAMRFVPTDTAAAAAAAADPPFPISLAQTDRIRLVAEATKQPAVADRLELSAFGAWIHAWGSWPSFAWDHELHQGRDVRARIATQGTLYPTGHRATFTKYVERIISTGLGEVAVLQLTQTILIDNPLAAVPATEAVTRQFPFDAVELLATQVDATMGAGWQDAGGTQYFWPADPDGQKVLFAVRLTAVGQSPVTVSLPLMFVADPPSGTFAADAAMLEALVTAYGQHPCSTGSEVIDLVRSAVPAPGDRHEVHALTIAANTTGAIAPMLASVDLAIPALRGLLGTDVVRTATFTADYLTRGDAADMILSLTSDVGIDFTQQSDRSGGLVAPKYVTDALSRAAGPVNAQALQALAASGSIDPAALFPAAATLLGFALRDLVKDLKLPPQIVPGIDTAGRPTATMTWAGVALKPVGCFVADPSSRLDLSVTTAAGGTDTSCSVSHVGLQLPPGPDALLTLTFNAIRFEQHDGKLPAVSIDGIAARFTGDLRLLQELQDAVDLSALSPFFDITPAGITAHYSVPIPELAAGVFVLRDAVFSARLDVPFDGRPLELTLAFASVANPFDLTVMMFGGGGYVEMTITHEGLTRFEIALEFGALIAVDFAVASAEVHALGGVRFTLADNGSVDLTGYIRIGGSVDILGLVSVSVELCVQLSYESQTNALVGRATMVIDIDLTLWSEPVELDTGEWVLAGHAPPAGMASGDPGVDSAHLAEPRSRGAVPDGVITASRPLTVAEGLQRWQAYRSAFADAR